jgi:tetrapyrrole methylase family protein/MazG family protein
MLSLIEPVCRALALDPASAGLQLLPAAALVPPPVPPASGADRAWSELHDVGPYPAPLSPFPLLPTSPALLFGLDAASLAAVVSSLHARYPAAHAISLVVRPGQPEQAIHALTLGELGHSAGLADQAWIYLPALPVHADVRGLETLQWVMERLAGPFGCPWDREQTHATLRAFLLEETHETLEALDAEDWPEVRDELGDVLLQVVFHAELARQAGRFDLGDVATAITSKLIRRHPHIFGDVSVSDSAEVLRNWQAIKASERAEKGQTDRKSLLDGIPASLPLLSAGQILGNKAAKVGFDWPTIDGVWAKIEEELAEVRAAPPEEQEAELGDALFALINLARWLNVDAESGLRQTITKFRRRFQSIEAAAAAQGRDLASLSLDESDALWEAAKRAE